jgi:hypothetical protein
MDKLERFLDQACRGVGGPRSLRSHVRQELREHLLDATAAHRAEGLSDDEALARALEEFGGADEVRTELAATHGHRVMNVVVDRALEWKEKTMKATWLWSTWAHVALALIIAAEIFFVVFGMAYLMPVTKKIVKKADLEDGGLSGYLPGSEDFLDMLNVAEGGTGLLLLAAAAAGWILFEWRFRSENKAFVRLAVMGTVALVMMGVVLATGAVVSIPMAIAVADIEGQKPEELVRSQMAQIESAAAELEKAGSTGDWEGVKRWAEEALQGSQRLWFNNATAAAIVTLGEQARIDELRRQVSDVHARLRDAHNAALQENPELLSEALTGFRENFNPLQEEIASANQEE